MAEAEELEDEVKLYIVQQLACFYSPSEVAASVKAEYGFEVSRQRVHRYDPTKKAGADLSAELKAHFEAARAALIDGTAETGIANKMVRVRWLHDMAVAAKTRGSFVVAAQLIEQAAREMGGAFTNKYQHELSGKDGAALVAVINLTGRPEPSPSS